MALMFADYLLTRASSLAGTALRQSLTLALLLISASLNATSLPNRPVAALNLQRYMGQWHEIAHLPLFFQKKCVGPIPATSVIGSNGKIRLHAACPTRNRPKLVDVVIIPEQERPAAFTIRFAWLAWLPHAWLQYWVIDIDPQYQWAVVGTPNAKHLWILARDRSMSQTLYQQLVERARERGYAVDNLMIVAPLDNP